MTARHPVTIDALTGLRGLACVWVVLHHARPALLMLFPPLEIVEPVLEHGWLGVEVFFVLSGFVIAHNYADRLAAPTRAALWDFWWARIARVHPVHLATLLVVLLLAAAAGLLGVELASQANYGPGNVLANVVLAQALPGARPLNGPAWSVSCEAVAYLAFPLLALVLTRLSPRRAFLAACVSIASCIGAMSAVRAATGTWQELGLAVTWIRLATEFVAGALLWVWWRSRERGGPAADVVVLLCLVVGAATLFLFERGDPTIYVVLPAIVVLVVAVPSCTGVVRTTLTTRPALWAGRISYSLYMVHALVLLVVTKAVGWQRVAGAPVVLRVLVLLAFGATVLAVAVATSSLIEEPGRRLVRECAARIRRDPIATNPGRNAAVLDTRRDPFRTCRRGQFFPPGTTIPVAQCSHSVGRDGAFECNGNDDGGHRA